MPVSRKILIWVTSLVPLLLLVAHPAVSERFISERPLPADTIIKDSFEAGTGLPVGKIQSVRGETFIFHRDPSLGYLAKAGLPLYQGDILQTPGNSRIQCRLVDGSRLVMAPGTVLTLLQSNSNSARNSSLSFLSLKQGGVRFYVSGSSEIGAFEFKVQTETAFVQAQKADFVIRSNPGLTEITTFENSRLEVTNLVEPEEIQILSDYQRAVVRPESGSPAVETVSAMDAEVLMAEFRLAPDTKLFATGANNYRAPDTISETPED